MKTLQKIVAIGALALVGITGCVTYDLSRNDEVFDKQQMLVLEQERDAGKNLSPREQTLLNYYHEVYGKN